MSLILHAYRVQHDGQIRLGPFALVLSSVLTLFSVYLISISTVYRQETRCR